MSVTATGCIFQATYRIVGGQPVVHLFGRLSDGATFVIRDHRQTPHFYVTQSDVDAGKTRSCDAVARPTDKVAFSGDGNNSQVARVDVATPPDAPAVRDALHRAGVNTYEADVRFAMRYLIDRNIRNTCQIAGEAKPGTGTTWVFDNPEVTPAAAADAKISPRVLSFDIETDADGKRLLAISCYGCGVDEVVIVDPRDRAAPDHALIVKDERAALDYFQRLVQRLDIDILTGWNVIDFDLTVLQRIAERLRFPLHLGRERGTMRLRPAVGYFGSGSANIVGRLVLDGIDLLRGAFVRMDDYSLDAVAREVLGEGKAMHSDNASRVDEILQNYTHDLDAFALYARTDARLALQIVEKLNLIELSFARARLTGMTPDRVAASIASFDFLYLAELGKRNIVAPTVRSDDARVFAAQGGGQVFEPQAGMHAMVWVFDFKSLYPSIMRSFNVDPLGYLGPQAPAHMAAEDVVCTEDGSAFRRGPAILPDMLNTLFPQREAAKAAGDGVASQAIKILMNSFYGVLGTPACRFSNPAIANAITSQGRFLLTWSKTWFEERGYTVLYGDTDSVFVGSGLADGEAALQLGNQLVTQFNTALTGLLDERYSVVSALEMEFEKLYAKLFLARTRGGGSGARKRYAGQRYGAANVEFTGMEVVRRDWTELAKVVQRELYARLFSDQPVQDYLASVAEDLRAGRLDDLLVYRKGLRKDVGEYTRNTPPHVQAARNASQPVGRVVEYVITAGGPVVVDELNQPPDREHYLVKQVLPVAEPVLQALGLKFDQVIGDDRQTSLF